MENTQETSGKQKSKLTTALRRLSIRLPRRSSNAQQPESSTAAASQAEPEQTEAAEAAEVANVAEAAATPASEAADDTPALEAQEGPTKAGELYDLLILTDVTFSMRTFLRSLNSSLQDIIRISATTACFSRIGVLGYCDYDERNPAVTEWSGWHSRDGDLSEVTQDALLSFVKNFQTRSGGDWPEATKTGLAHAYQLMRPGAKTIVLLYADAPPHIQETRGLWQAEQDELRKPDVYGGTAELFADWASAANTLSQGDKQAQIFTIIEPTRYLTTESTAQYTYLAERTGGICIAFDRNPSAAAISKLTVGLLLAWMGADKQGAKLDKQQLARHAHFADTEGLDQITSETDPAAACHLPVSKEDSDKNALKENLTHYPLSLDTLPGIVPRREHPVMDFAARYKADQEYRDIVVEQLTEIIESDVAAITLNPVFGTLWRTVCNDRLNPARNELITKFGLQVDKAMGERKEDMKKWLEESYDWAGEILETIESVPEEARYPCIFLDPTQQFSHVEDEADGTSNSMKFTRDELLEIGRSCDARILRRLGRILTRLTYVNSEDELPAHIKAVPEAEVPRIPVVLAQPEHDRKFWKILLHTVLPGTMLAGRPAALLAALSLRMGMKPLETAAYTELFAYRYNWNRLDIPETWSTNCLSLLLDADQKYQQLMVDANTPLADDKTILPAKDRKLFRALVDYKLLEMNLGTTLTAEVGWTPNKSRVPMGPVAICKTCQFPRSVTIMAEDGNCGLCAFVAAHGYPGSLTHDNFITAKVSKTDNSTTLAAWSECSMADCRAQYVVYHTDKLNVRPKCHYCRQKTAVSPTDPNHARLTTAPCLTCTRCLNRIIYPTPYRPSDLNPSTYTCPACTTGTHPTLTPTPTTPHTLLGENGTSFLLQNPSSLIPDTLLFKKRSLFHTISNLTGPLSSFPHQVTILPANPSLVLTLRGKTIHNTPALLASLQSWISARRVQRDTCSLCFSSRAKQHLRLACGGRKGCRQIVCEGCVAQWYGLNAPGKIINVAALSCPFCRRMPTGRVKLPGGLRVLAGLRDAVREQGEWVYGWCGGGCGRARRYVERVCARGAAEEVEGWRCEECVGVVEGEGGKAVVKECPGCRVATEKVAGCDHMECTVDGCGTHWCWNCGEEVGVGEIYAHMSTEHGGWYGGRDFEEYVEEEYLTEEE